MIEGQRTAQVERLARVERTLRDEVHNDVNTEQVLTDVKVGLETRLYVELSSCLVRCFVVQL